MNTVSTKGRSAFHCFAFITFHEAFSIPVKNEKYDERHKSKFHEQ